MAEISPDLVRFCQIQSKSHQIYLKYCQNLGFFTEIWKIFAKSGFLSDGSGFLGFGGRETETDLLESVSGGEDLPLTAGVVRLAGVGSDPVGFLGWVGSLNGFGQP